MKKKNIGNGWLCGIPNCIPFNVASDNLETVHVEGSCHLLSSSSISTT